MPITYANVTVLDSWERGTKAGKFQDIALRVAIALTADGGTAGDIPASAFELAEIYQVSTATLDVSGTRNAQPVFIEASGAGIQTAAFATGLGADVTGTLYLTIYGRPAIG